MPDTVEIKVPDIGDFTDVPIIEVLVAAGDEVAPEDPLITLESDKATMDVPSPAGGTVRELRVAVGDTVSEGSLILMLEPEARRRLPAGTARSPPTPRRRPRSASSSRRPPTGRQRRPSRSRSTSPTSATSPTCRSSRCWSSRATRSAAEDPLITLESDKATMDVPSPSAGIVAS